MKHLSKEVSFPLAKLLKETVGTELFSGNMAGFLMDKPEVVKLPTIAEVIDWLYKKHGIWITVCVIGADGFGYWLHNKNRKRLNPEDQGGYWYSPTEAYEAAIEHTLEELI